MKKDPPHGETPKKGEVNVSAETFHNKALSEVEAFQAHENAQNIPPHLQIKMEVINILDFGHFAEYFGFFRAIFLHLQPYFALEEPTESQIIKEQSIFHGIFQDTLFSKIHIHLNSSLMVYRLALYQCANEFRGLPLHLFLFNKNTDFPETIPLYYEMNTIEKRVLELLQKSAEISVSELCNLYAAHYESKSLSYMLKVVNRLIEMKYLESSKVGREKQISLTSFSSSVFSVGKYDKILKKSFKA